MAFTAASIDIQRKLAFAELKPKCVAVSQLVLRTNIDAQTSQELSVALQDLFHQLEQTVETQGILTSSFGDYIFFPLSHIFARQDVFTNSILETSLQCLDILISKCWHISLSGELAKQLMIMITFIIGGHPDGSKPSKWSEWTKFRATKCLESLFAAVSRSGPARQQFGMIELAPSLGHSLTVLLDIIPATSYTDLQVSATAAVQHLFTGCIQDDDILASFLPGTVSTLCKFLDSRTSASRKSKALVKGLETLSDVLRIVLMDIKTSNLPTSDGMNGTFNGGGSSITTIRTQSWLHGTSEQVRMGLTGVCGLRKHRMLNVKLALLKLCKAITRDCPQSLASSLPVTVETIISLSADKEEDLNSQAKEALITLAGFNENITQALEKSLHGWILSLPRVLQANDEDKKSHLLREIAASFKVLSDLGRSSEILLDLFSRNMKDSVMNLSEHKAPIIAPESVMSEISPASMELIRQDVVGEVVYPPTMMPSKNQEETSNNTLKLLEMLGGTSIGLRLVHEHVREARVGTQLSKAISIWMALNILQASQSQPQDDWLADVSSSSSLQVSKLTAELYSVTLSSLLDTYDSAETLPQLTCLSLEVLAYTAGSMTEKFRAELVDCLYPIVHLFGSSVLMVQNHAILTLESISKACGYASTKDLLVENADYLVNAVSLKLNMFNVQPQAPQVLLMMIKLCGAQLIPFLDDLVVSIFAALENYHGYEKLTESLFKVLEGIVEESASGEDQLKLITHGETRAASQQRNRIKKKHRMTLDDVLDDLDDLIQRESRLLVAEVEDEEKEEPPHKPWGKGKSNSPNPFGDDENEEDDALEPSPKQEEPKPSHTYLMIESIARLSQNFLTSSSPSLRLHLLHLISTASPLLSKQEDNFLPLINQLWPVVVERLKDSEPHVTITTIKTITRLCVDCGDFLSSRIEEIWPVVREIAGKAKREVDKERERKRKGRIGASAVAKRQQGNAYATHNLIWGAVVPLLEAMVGYTRITETMFDEIVGMVAGYLADGGEEYGKLKAALEEVDGDVVWLEIMIRGGGAKDNCTEDKEASREVEKFCWNVPETVVIEVPGGKQRLIAFESLVF
ncbi:hypothetical protein TWF694_000525 [Orbilia ellipsospora]|uniref:TEL2-interacting protein 1 n=1 Tax=Orbilia ellipsospora TaxID=2528407 RepID=A0AAV9XP71_9PEZI